MTTPSQEGQGNLSEDGDFEQERIKLLKAISHFEKAKSNYEKKIQSNKSFIIGIILGLCGNLFITSFFEFGPIQFLQNISGIYWYSIKYIILIISFLPFLILGLYIYRNIKQERRLLKGIEVIEDQVLTSFIRGQIDELKHEEEEG